MSQLNRGGDGGAASGGDGGAASGGDGGAASGGDGGAGVMEQARENLAVLHARLERGAALAKEIQEKNDGSWQTWGGKRRRT